MFRTTSLRAVSGHRGVALLAAALLLACPALDCPGADAADRETPRVGVFSHGTAPGAEQALAGIRDGFRLAGVEPVILERSVADDDARARSALAEFAFERVDLVFALGGRAAKQAREVLREPAVVFTVVSEPAALELPGRANVCGTASGIAAADWLDMVRRAVPSLGTLAVSEGPEDAETEHLLRALDEEATRRGIALVRLAANGDSAAARATQVARALTEGVDALLLPATVPDGDVEVLARTLADRGLLLLGARRGQLDAGCAVVLRTDPRRLGETAAALAMRILDGADPGELGVQRPARRRLEVSLAAARRLGYELPLTVVAAADHVVPAFGGRR